MERLLHARGGKRYDTLVMDIDGLPVDAHGRQQGSAYNGHYKRNIFLPLIASCAGTGDMLGATLRRGNAHVLNDCYNFIKKMALRLRTDVARKVIVRLDAAFNSGALCSKLEERQANWLGYSGCKSRVMKLKLGTYPREPCVATREGGHEASVAVCVARDIEHRKVHSLGRRGFLQGRRQHVRHRYGETANRPTVSKTPWTHIRILPGPGRSATRPAIVRGRNGKALAP